MLSGCKPEVVSSISSILSVPGGSKIDLQLDRQLKMTPDLLKPKEKSENNATPNEGSAGIGDHVRSGRGQCVDERSVWYELTRAIVQLGASLDGD